MRTWAGSVAAITALYAAMQVSLNASNQNIKMLFQDTSPLNLNLQIGGVFLSHFMIQFKREARRQQQSGAAFEMKPLPPEPDVIPRWECCLLSQLS